MLLNWLSLLRLPNAVSSLFTLRSSLTQIEGEQVERHSLDFRDGGTVEFGGGIQEESLPDVKLTVIKEPVLVRNFARNV